MQQSARPLTKRLYFMDNLRAAVILLVIVFHVALGYMAPAPEWWYVIDTKNSGLFNLFVLNVDVFIMPTMFFVAGYFMLPALRRQGTAAFMRAKLWRIALPWLIGVFLFAPAITYMIWYSRTDTPPPYLFYLQNMFITPAVFNHAHYWFLGVLCWFFALTLLVRQVKPAWLEPSACPAAPTSRFFVLATIATTLGFWSLNVSFPADTWFSKLYVISFQPCRILSYAYYFAMGIYAWRQGWFNAGGYAPAWSRWAAAAALVMVVFTVFRVTVPVPPTLTLKAVHAFLHSLFSLTMVWFLLAVFQRFVNSSAQAWQRLAAVSYIVYYIHQGIVLPIAYRIQKVDMAVGIKYLIVAVSSVILTVLAAELCRRLLPSGRTAAPRVARSS